MLQKNNEYKKLYAEYLAKLPPAERIRVLEEDQGKKVKEKENVPVKKVCGLFSVWDCPFFIVTLYVLHFLEET